MEDQTKIAKKRGRGKETLFRVSYQHQGQLIQNADYKANLIISISTTIISAIIAIIGYGAVTGTSTRFGYFVLVPILIIVLSCLVALIFSVHAARPKIIFPPSNRPDQPKSSLLFFRTIASHSQPDYIDKMKVLLKSEEDIFEQMTIDLYNQGVVLKIKYDLLRSAYSVLLFGFIAGVVSFLVMLGILW